MKRAAFFLTLVLASLIPTGTAGAAVLFDGSSLSSWTGQQKAQADRIREVTDVVRLAGGKSLRFEIRPGDLVGTTARSEVLWGGDTTPPPALNEGQIIHMAFSLRFASDFPMPGENSASTGHSLYSQLKRGTGSPKWSLDGNANFSGGVGQFQHSYDDDLGPSWTTRIPTTRSVWHDFIISMKIHSTSADPIAGGWVEVRHKLSTESNFVVKFPRTADITAQALTNYLKFGYYRSSNEQATGVLHGAEYRVYSTLNEALNNWGAPPPVATVPPKVTGLFAINQPNGNPWVELGWDDVPNINTPGYEYRIYRGGAFVAPSGDPSYYDTLAVNGQTYTYQVSAANSVGEGAKSDPVTITYGTAPPPTTKPAAVTNLRAVAEVGGKVTVSWTASPGATSYRGYRGGSLRTTLTSSPWVDTGRVAGSTYVYEIEPVNSVGAGPKTSVTVVGK